MFVIVDEPDETKPKHPRPKADPLKAPTHEGLVTSPDKRKPCVSPDGSPCEYDIGDLPTRKAPKEP